MPSDTQWWQRSDLYYAGNKLVFAGQELQKFARQVGTPSFVYHGARVQDRLSALHASLATAGFKNRAVVYFAMKANRFAPLLTVLKHTGRCGIDACSPAEIEHAISCGFLPEQISFTATSLSEQDFQVLARHQDVFVNCDSLHTIRKLGQLCRGRDIGIRINPEIGISYAGNDKLQYSGGQASKFGIYRAQFEEALTLAAEYDLTVSKIHVHTGCGYLNQQLEQWDRVLTACQWFIKKIPGLKAVNVGGGLGVPHTEQDQPLDLERWASILHKHFGDTELGIEVEPGEYLLKDAGVLLLTVNSVEMKNDTLFAGVDAGFNIAPEPAFYSLPFLPVALQKRSGDDVTVSIAGNINEALDVWYRNISMSPLQSGDHLALLNAGAYSSSMASNHCLRGNYKEFLIAG